MKKRHSRVGGNPDTLKVLLMFFLSVWLPAFAGVTTLNAAPVDYDKVVIKNRDNLRLSAYYHAPERSNPVVVMLHGLASSKEEWLGFAGELNQHGWGWLAYDARGHGESSLTRGTDGGPNGYKYFGPPGRGSEWEKMIDDVGAVLRFLEAEKGIKKNRVILIGASLGANVVLNYAGLTRFEGKIVLLSPGLNYQEVKVEAPIRVVPPSHLLLVAHPADTYAFSSCTLMKESVPKLNFWSDVKAGHGVQMLDDALKPRLFQWLNEEK